jgi:hypothetical protein
MVRVDFYALFLYIHFLLSCSVRSIVVSALRFEHLKFGVSNIFYLLHFLFWYYPIESSKSYLSMGSNLLRCIAQHMQV